MTNLQRGTCTAEPAEALASKDPGPAYPAFPEKQLNPDLYTVAWIAPLEIELEAARHMLDVAHTGRFPDYGSDYIYIAGEMMGHNVIIATFPTGRLLGAVFNAILASHIKKTFRNICVSLLVGVATGIPRLSNSPFRDIRLGDVLVAMPDGDDAAILAYDRRKNTGTAAIEGFLHGHANSRTAPEVIDAIRKIQLTAPSDVTCFVPFYKEMKQQEHAWGTFQDPGQAQDYLHDSDGQVVPRMPRPIAHRTRVWYGPIGSGQNIIENARRCDLLLAKHNVIGLEMEAKGIMNVLPVGVIRGVCDYADLHNNKQWQPYAAAMAAAYAKAILGMVALPRSGTAFSQAPSRQEEPTGARDSHTTSSSGDQGSSTPATFHLKDHGSVIANPSGFNFNFGQSKDKRSKVQPIRPASRDGFEVAIICALPIEATAVEAVFDHYWDEDEEEGPPFGKLRGDVNSYTTGVIGRHNVVMAHMPGMGLVSAATVATCCKMSFPNIKLGLVVGICGVVPSLGEEYETERVLGDVFISNGVVQFDFGRQTAEGLVRKSDLYSSYGRPPPEIRSFLMQQMTGRSQRNFRERMVGYLNQLQQDRNLHAQYPGKALDRLVAADYDHPDKRKLCDELDCYARLVTRQRLRPDVDDPVPNVSIGTFACGSSVMKSATDRDRIAATEGVIAFEMEGAGAWDNFPCVVIKGACDYADTHKNKRWQRYAAASAAACLKSFLWAWVSAGNE